MIGAARRATIHPEAVKIEQLQKQFGSVVAVKDVTFTVPAGEIFGLLGPNGAGKTTTLKCLCTLTQPDRGQVLLNGIDVLKQPRQARQNLGYISQEAAPDKMLTGRELLQLQAALYHLPTHSIKPRIEYILELLDLKPHADKLTGQYSGGLRKRLDLAAGFLHQPPVLVLDEPTVGLDIESRVIVWDFLRYLKAQGTTILITSHYLEEIDALADRVAIIDQGGMIASGTPSELKDRVGGDRITLRIQEFSTAAESQAAQTLLSSLDIVQSVIINQAQGNSLNLVVTPQTNALSVIQQTLSDQGLPIFSVSQSRPSLDDVYLAATGQTLMDAELSRAEGNKTRPTSPPRQSQSVA
jgi:ABC-2 type transport system ATP-binding protein